MAEQNFTVWQRLTQAFGPNSLLNQDYPSVKFDKKELLKTTSKREYEQKLLQAQQTFYLSNQWAKLKIIYTLRQFIMNQQDFQRFMTTSLWNSHLKFLRH